MYLRDIPRNQIEKSIEEAARGLKPDPGEQHKGECDMFRGATGLPVCRGTCKGAKQNCRILRIMAEEGSHSDLYNVLVICSCKTWEELLKEAGVEEPAP